ncbi:hypothetical protein JXB37_06680 [candidate division WOR-3 bacterium]|nr:hypothetical protein [candidate division WOR-3 bacterium]
MRRIAFGLLVLGIAAGLLVTTGCQRDNSLRIIRAQGDNENFGDLSDFATYRDPTDPEADPELIYVIPGDLAELELQYVEIGLGLPTWTPYQAHLEQATITYRSAGEPGEWEGTYITYGIKIPVMADREGDKTTRATIPIMTSEWKEFYFGAEAADDPSDLGPVATVVAEIKLKGFDEASGRPVECENAMTIEVGNWWDDISRIGQ